MISYKPFYLTLLRKNITEYNLIYKQGVSPGTLSRMKKNKAITTTTIDTFCSILDCDVTDIIEYIKTNSKNKTKSEAENETNI